MEDTITAIARATLAVAIVLGLVVGLVALTMWRGGAFKPPTHEQIVRREQRAVVWHWMRIIFLAAFGIVAVTGAIALARRFHVRATTIYSDQGIFPIIRLNRRVWVPDPNGGPVPNLVTIQYLIDPNRIPGGVTGVSPTGTTYALPSDIHPGQVQITQAALRAQQQRAANEGHGGLIDVNVGGDSQTPALLPPPSMPDMIEVLNPETLGDILTEAGIDPT